MAPLAAVLHTLLLFQSALPPQPPVAPAPHRAFDPELAKHLAAWKKAASSRKSLRAEIKLTRTDAVFKKEKSFSGSLLWMRPDLVILRLNNDSDKTGNDYEAYLCDGTSIYEYNGISRTIIDRRNYSDPRFVGPPTHNEHLQQQFFLTVFGRPILDPRTFLPIQFVTGLGRENEPARYCYSLHSVDKWYVYLDFEPTQDRDRAEFTHGRLALIGPDNANAYAVAAVSIVRPSGDRETWRVKAYQTNIPKLTPKDFAFQEVPGFRRINGASPNSEPDK